MALLFGRGVEFVTLRDLIVGRAALGDQVFVHIGDEFLTYEEAHLRSNRIANALAGFGVHKGDVIGTSAYNSIEHLCIWFACLKLGAIFAPFNVALRPPELEYALADTGASVYIVEEELADRYTPIRGRNNVRVEFLIGAQGAADRLGLTSSTILATGATSDLSVEMTAHDPIGVIYTGGSSGLPKGVLVSHSYHIASALRYQDVSRAQAGDVMYSSGQLFHSGGQQLGVVGPMFSGITSVMTRWFSVSKLWSIINKRGVNVLHLPGPMYGPILDRTPAGGGPDHPIRFALAVATGQVRREVRDAFEARFRFPLLEVYGQTEIGGSLLCSERLGEQRPGSSGHPYGFAEIRVVDENDQPVATGVEGEIVARPTEPYTFMLEYLNKPEMTFRTWRNLWHHTGDLGYLDVDGFLYFKGRKSFWIRRRGENVSAFEVEMVIAAHPSVAECAVVGVPSDIGDEDIKAYVRVRDGETLDPIAIVQWCEERIAYFKVPRYIEFADDFPRSAAKREIERHTLRERGIGTAWDRQSSQPSSPTGSHGPVDSRST